MPATIPAHTMQYLIEDHIDQVYNLDCRACTYFDEDLDIETVHSSAWTKQSLREFLKQRKPPTHGYVLTVPRYPGEIVAYMAYELVGDEIQLAALVVDPRFRGQGLGMALMLKLHASILQSPKRKTISIHVREHDTASIGFFKKLRFRSKLVRSYFDDGEDAIRFWFTETKTAEEASENNS